MNVEFILGRPSSGREDVIVQRIREAVKEDVLSSVLVIVPPQATYATECMLLNKLGAAGMMGVNVASISRLSLRVLTEVYGAAIKTIGAAGKSMAVKRVMDENKDELRALHKLRSRGSLPPLISELIAELKQMDISPAMLYEFPVNNENTALKFRDIALIYDKLNGMLAGVVDTEDRLNLVSDHIHEAAFIRDARVFIHGFDMYNSQTMRFIANIMNTARSTAVSFLHAGEDEADGEVYGICRENRERLARAAGLNGVKITVVSSGGRRSADILHLEKNIFAFPAERKEPAKDISISYAGDIRAEVSGVAAQVAYLTQKSGLKFSDIAVLYGSEAGYASIVQEKFGLSNIPLFTGEKRRLLSSSLADFVLGAFELARGRLSKETLLTHAATGYCDISRAEAGLLQNYAYENIRDGFAFLKQFDGEIESIRQKFMEPLAELRQRSARPPQAGNVVKCVRSYMERLDIRGKVERKSAQMRINGLLEEADFTEQAYERICEVLEQALHLPEGGSAPYLPDLIRAGMENERIGVIPPAVNEVLCGDIAGTYLPEIKVLFVMGVNEGIIPNYSRATDIITDDERELILSGIKGLKHTGGVDRQRLLITKALSRPTDKLYISCVLDGKKQKSQLIYRMHSLFESIRENRLEDIAPLLSQNAFEVATGYVRDAADGYVNAASVNSSAAVFLDDNYADKLNALKWGVEHKNEAVRIDPELAKRLYGESISSATRVESFYSCPYGHFIKYGVRAKALRESGINSIDAGSYAHAVLDLLSKEIAHSGKSWAKISEEELSGLVNKCSLSVRETNDRYILNKHNQAVLDAVQRDVGISAKMIREQCLAGELVPYATEHTFDVMGIKGVIDRIDAARVDGENYFGIVDYKTGLMDFDLARAKAGLDLQLIIYIIAVKELLGEDYLFAGANYMRIYTAIREREQALLPLYRMRGIAGAEESVAAKLYGQADSNSLFSINVRIKKDGEYHALSEARYYPDDKLQTLVRHTLKLISGAKKRIRDGEDAIAPARDGGDGLPCRYCDYACVCMIDKSNAGGVARDVIRGERDLLLKEMEEELEGSE